MSFRDQSPLNSPSLGGARFARGGVFGYNGACLVFCSLREGRLCGKTKRRRELRFRHGRRAFRRVLKKLREMGDDLKELSQVHDAHSQTLWSAKFLRSGSSTRSSPKLRGVTTRIISKYSRPSFSISRRVKSYPTPFGDNASRKNRSSAALKNRVYSPRALRLGQDADASLAGSRSNGSRFHGRNERISVGGRDVR